MSAPSELWKKWQRRIADEKLPLKKWLGGSDHSVVYLTQRNDGQSSQAAIKFISARNVDRDAQFSRWAAAAKLSHPHLIRLFGYGRCQIDNIPFLYIVMEYAEENLAEILPLRPLAPVEASEMLPPVVDALSYLHQAGYAHGSVQPSNIMAVDNQLKISADSLARTGEHNLSGAPNRYSAPEFATSGPSPASDVWSLGSTLAAVMTQNEKSIESTQTGVSVPETIPQPFREIARQCRIGDPRKRATLSQILNQLGSPISAMAKRQETREEGPQPRSKLWIVVALVVAALFVIAFIGIRFSGNRAPAPEAETARVASQPSATTATAPSEKQNIGNGVNARGSVLQKVMPAVSRGALNTITGHIKVSVHVTVDGAGNVTQARLISAGPSKYFAQHALAAARGWKFNPPQADGHAASSQWTLRFEFGKSSTQVFPTETSPSS